MVPDACNLPDENAFVVKQQSDSVVSNLAAEPIMEEVNCTRAQSMVQEGVVIKNESRDTRVVVCSSLVKMFIMMYCSFMRVIQNGEKTSQNLFALQSTVYESTGSLPTGQSHSHKIVGLEERVEKGQPRLSDSKQVRVLVTAEEDMLCRSEVIKVISKRDNVVVEKG